MRTHLSPLTRTAALLVLGLGLAFGAKSAFASSYQSVSDAPQTFSNDKTLNGNLTVTCLSPYGCNETVGGDAGFGGNVTVSGSLTVTGAFAPGSDFTVTGDAGVTGSVSLGTASTDYLKFAGGASGATLDTNGGTLTVGGTGATTITIGRTGQAVGTAGTTQLANASTDYVSVAGGASGATIDTNAGTLGIGTTNATTITIGRSGQTATVASAMSYFTGGQEEPLIAIPQVSLANSTKLGGYGLPGLNSVGTSRAFTLQAITGAVTTASGGGAANTVITATDGTNTCTFTIPCNSAPPAGSSSTGAIRIAGANGTGAGCVYPAAAAITISVTTGGCTTTQPQISGALSGVWQ